MESTGGTEKNKLVSFDLDGTLIRGIHSVMLPCILNGKEKEHSIIQEKEESRTIVKNNIKPAECIAAGDGSTDIPVFKYCGRSIAINSSSDAREEATYAIDTDDLMDILVYV